jgi:hypothetical protein
MAAQQNHFDDVYSGYYISPSGTTEATKKNSLKTKLMKIFKVDPTTNSPLPCIQNTNQIDRAGPRVNL